ncbi:4Fe-4S binding protein [Methanosarcina sp. Z-7115]|uniref:4Fe-4S binding protein n=1 Tax=Methanosarcina baikalica TaxID=3073890 RepID=A0ABU2CZ11_9EURY|nr:4Fe-4S binding protein [Methanosarcina sp. Z-7115]MDR7664963.1 4Fe-4S binding protein [Methanosarcina sp. Z-7115]
MVQSKKCVGCGICYSVCSVNTKLMKSDDFYPDTVELAIRIVDRATIISDEACIRCGICSKICPVESLTVLGLESATS